jgi:hypothetical protein
MLTRACRDGSATISATWFNQPWLERQLQPGRRCAARAAGALRVRRPQLRHRQRAGDGGLRAGLSASEEITPKKLRELVAAALPGARRSAAAR